ncbi:hypothetical protein [Peredibacter starrii]|uniref:Uncharacterized protein n=1 Tax=Peredibacter starrii TaxID=28202 RepID=A0AAX4HKN8_9BACT|nr:hypothetical protein [Peredibacter starrii]WPU63725.1 hypothetical protein SOO65_13605 [Peredibacter starrii]
MKRIISLIFLFSVTLNAWAWSERGNSGFSIICEDASQNQFYDAYETKFRYGLDPIFPQVNQECSDRASCLEVSLQIARELLNRLPADPRNRFNKNVGIKKFALERIESFTKEANFLDNIEILPINDAGIGFIPKNCDLRQTVVQRVPLFKHDKRYIISNEYWDQLNIQQQAAGIVHEILYGYYGYIQNEAFSSEMVRYFNSLVLANELKSLTEEEYRLFLNRVYYGN